MFYLREHKQFLQSNKENILLGTSLWITVQREVFVFNPHYALELRYEVLRYNKD